MKIRSSLALRNSLLHSLCFARTIQNRKLEKRDNGNSIASNFNDLHENKLLSQPSIPARLVHLENVKRAHLDVSFLSYFLQVCSW